MSRRRAQPAIVFLVALVALAVFPVRGAPAQTTSTTTTTTTTTTSTTTTTTKPGPPPDPTAPGVSLVSQPPWIATQGVQLLALHLDDPAIATIEDAAVEVTVHRSVDSRSEFDQAVRGDGFPGTVASLTFPFSTLSVNGRGEFLVAFGVSGSGAARAVAVDEPGVYPVEVGVVEAGERSTFVTWMIVVDPDSAEGAEPLRVSWIWQVTNGPVQQANGLDKASLAEMRRGGRLDRIATLLSRADDFPLTVGIGPETIETWIEASRTDPAFRRGATRVRRAARQESVQLLPEPYVPIDGPTIEASQLGSEVPALYVAGSNVIENATGEIPDPRTALEDPIDDASVRRLTQLLIGRFVVRDSALTPIEQPRTPAQPFSLVTTSAGAVQAVATDSGLEQLLEMDGPPALRAQRLLAGLAEIAYEAPSQARGVVLAVPHDWQPDIATITLLLRDLAENPLVRPTTLDDYFAEVAPEERDGVALQRTLAPITTSGTRPLFASEYRTATDELEAYETMVGPDDPSVAAGHHALKLSLSTSNTRPEALAHLQTIHDNLRAVTSGITTTVKTLTLTARQARLPLSFQNDTDRDGIRVRVHLESPKLIFPEGNDVVLELPIGHSTKAIPVEARASGTFTLTVTLESADGSFQLGPPTRVTIRSAVFSGIGVALTVGALLFLAGWWGNHFRRTRRGRRQPSAV